MSYSDSITKILSLEENANKDLNGAEITTKYIANPDTNEFTQTHKTLLESISKTSALPFIAPTLLNSWVNYDSGYYTAGYLKDENGTVHVKGMVKIGANDSVIFTLPAGYRPAANIILQGLKGSNSLGQRIDIYTTGDVRYRGSDAPVTWVQFIHSFKGEL